MKADEVKETIIIEREGGRRRERDYHNREGERVGRGGERDELLNACVHAHA
jgi:hypothetical protein